MPNTKLTHKKFPFCIMPHSQQKVQTIRAHQEHQQVCVWEEQKNPQSHSNTISGLSPLESLPERLMGFQGFVQGGGHQDHPPYSRQNPPNRNLKTMFCISIIIYISQKRRVNVAPSVGNQLVCWMLSLATYCHTHYHVFLRIWFPWYYVILEVSAKWSVLRCQHADMSGKRVVQLFERARQGVGKLEPFRAVLLTFSHTHLCM